MARSKLFPEYPTRRQNSLFYAHGSTSVFLWPNGVACVHEDVYPPVECPS